MKHQLYPHLLEPLDLGFTFQRISFNLT